MLQLNSIGPLNITLDDAKLPLASQQVTAALLYLTVEGGRIASRRSLVDLFFPNSDAEAASHALRQLIYRLRKLGVPIETEGNALSVGKESPVWDVRLAERAGGLTDVQIEALTEGYLAGYAPELTPTFEQWLEQHRAHTSQRLSALLVGQLRSARRTRDAKAIAAIARACLAVDPLNEDATVASAETLALAGSKAEALRVLDRYVTEVGQWSKEFTSGPALLRERIRAHSFRKASATPLIGRESEIAMAEQLLAESLEGTPRCCVYWGVSGIGKTRLMQHVVEMASLKGFLIIECPLQPHSQHRPFDVLRRIGVTLLDGPGALGASPPSIKLLRSIVGREPLPSPEEWFTGSQVAVAEIIAAASELVDAVCSEVPVLIWVDDCHWSDEASLHLLTDVLSTRRPLCIFATSHRPIKLSGSLTLSSRVCSVELGPLPFDDSTRLLEAHFVECGMRRDDAFVDAALASAGGIPFYLEELFRAFVLGGNACELPPSVSAALSGRLDRLPEPARSVLDAITVLGRNCHIAALENVTELPRFRLAEALRALEEAALSRSRDGQVRCAHDLVAAAVTKHMPDSVKRLLNSAAAHALAKQADVDPISLAAHLELGGMNAEASSVLAKGGDEALSLGRPQDAIQLLDQALRLAPADSRDIQLMLLTALFKCGETHRAGKLGAELGALEGALGVGKEIATRQCLLHSGDPIQDHTGRLKNIARDLRQGDGDRALAAGTVLTAAEESADATLATEVIGFVQDIRPSNTRTIGPFLIYDTTFGSHERAIELAIQLSEIVLQAAHPSLSINMLYNAAFALWRCGEVAKAESLLLTTYEVSTKARLRQLLIYSSSLLSEIAWTTDRPHEAKRWFAIAKSNDGIESESANTLQWCSAGLKLAMDLGDFDQATEYLKIAERCLPDKDSRLAMEFLALSARLQFAQGRPVSAELINALRAAHLRRRGYGQHDAVADTLIGCLKFAGDLTTAICLRDQYVHKLRRDRHPIARSYLNLVTD